MLGAFESALTCILRLSFLDLLVLVFASFGSDQISNLLLAVVFAGVSTIWYARNQL